MMAKSTVAAGVDKAGLHFTGGVTIPCRNVCAFRLRVADGRSPLFGGVLAKLATSYGNDGKTIQWQDPPFAYPALDLRSGGRITDTVDSTAINGLRFIVGSASLHAICTLSVPLK